MNRSLYTKLILIILVIITSLMTVAGAFLMRGVQNFYVLEFYNQMEEVFADQDMADSLRSAVNSPRASESLSEIMQAYAGRLGVDSNSRNFYILSGDTGSYLSGSDTTTEIEMTSNIITALSGTEGYESNAELSYMDVAIPLSGEGGSFIIYIRDNKDTVSELNEQLFMIILEALGIGLLISAFFGLLLAKTMISPIQNLTEAASKVAAGDFSDKLENEAKDEIGVLTRTFNDMATRLETTLSELTKSEQMRREFVANVSHELRTPITSIRSYAETMEDDEDMPMETRIRFLNVILNESDRMAKIVGDLLTLSRFDAGSIEFSFEEFSFEKSVTDVHNAMAMEASARGHEFSLKMTDDIPRIIGDRARLEQVIINMVSNAIKYTKEGGNIKITVGSRGGEVWCTVADNGIGIPEADVDRIFERFYRVDKARSRESGGTGLGLSIANEIVQRHGGRLKVTSKEKKGTRISMYLPIGGPENEQV